MFAIDITTQKNDYAYLPTNTAVTNYLPKVDARVDSISSKDITDRQIASVIVSDTIKFKEYNLFDNKKEMLDYFLQEVTKIYLENGLLDVDVRIKNFVVYTQKIKFKSSNRVFYDAKDLYDFLHKVTLFIAIYFKTPYNKIVNIISYFFYRCLPYRSIKRTTVKFFRALEIKYINEIATNKNLYLCLDATTFKYDFNLYNLHKFIADRHQENSNKIATINQVINSCHNEFRKQTISKYITEILQICADKYIAMNNPFVEIVKELVTSTEITDINIVAILKKIIIYLQAIAEKNTYADINMLTSIICGMYGKTSAKLLLSINNLQDAQLQDIALRKYDKDTVKKLVFAGFPTQSIINKKIVTSKIDTISRIKKSYIDLNDYKCRSDFYDAKRKVLSIEKYSDTNKKNDIKAKKRKTDNQTIDYIRKSKRLENIISNIATAK